MFLLAAGETNPLIPQLGELVIGFLAFAILVGILMRLAFPRIEQLYAERHDKIEGGIERAEQAQAEAQRTLEEYRTQLAEARHESNRIREDAHVQARQIEQESRGRAQEEYQRIVARGEEQLSAERQQIVTTLRGEIGRLAVDLSERIVGESLTDEDLQRRVVDRFLDSIDPDVVAAGPDGGAEPRR